MATTAPVVSIDHVHIPVDHILANPRNPRPIFHLQDDDPHIAELGVSLRTDGQTQDAMVFALEGHWCEPDRPGSYMLLQGERRWRACKMSKIATLRCQIVETPKDSVSELFLLGAEGSYKQEWQPFYQLRWARDLAAEMGVPLDNPAIRQKSGLTRVQLVEATKMFTLEKPIIDRVERYEEERYRQRLGSLRKQGRLKANEAGVQEFTVSRAASVYDLFLGLRKNFQAWDLIDLRTDLELQELLADQATGRRSKHSLDNLIQMVRANKAATCDPGLRIELERILTKRATIGEAGARFGFAELEKFRGLEKKLESLNLMLADLNRKKFVMEANLSEADINRGVRKVHVLSKALDITLNQLERRAKALEDEREER